MSTAKISSKPIHRQAGLSLVEVFVALLVLSVGLIALAKLQVDLVRGGGDSRARAAALAIAESKIEDLRTFSLREAPTGVTWPVAANQPLAWSMIADNAGGRMASGALTQAGVQYNLSWTVTQQSTDGPVAGGGNQSLYKVVDVNVSWTGPQGDVQTVTATASIPDTPPALTALASTPITGGDGPALTHVPGQQPEVISVPVDVGGTTKRETSKPLPIIKKTADSTMVTFDVVNYTTDTNIVQRREEFVTITCRCTFAGTGAARTPAKVVLVGNLLRDQPGKIVTKAIGVPANAQQPPLCNICCRDHHDYTDGTDNYRYNPEDTSNHAHYLKTDLSTTVTSGDYDEACRLKRVNGIFQVFEDWNLRTLTVLPKTDLELNAANADNYVQAVQDYVIAFADAKANGGAVPTELNFTPSAVSLDPDAKQLLARAIYIDNMPDDLLAKIRAILSDGDTSNDDAVLSLVPFYEVHLTKLADWISRDTAQTTAKVTSNAIPDQNNVVDDGTLDGAGSVYSRGLAQPQSNATTGDTTRIIATARRYNTGITNTAPINTTEDDGHPITQTVTPGPYYYTNTDPEPTPPAEHRDGSMLVSVGGGISISGSFQKATGSPKSPLANKINPPTGSNGAVCVSTSASGDTGEGYNCTVPANWTGSITFSSSQGYSFCLNDDGSTGTPCTALPSGVWTISSPVTSSITQDVHVWRP
ncbi:MAG: prepilin-type N-terminal cleavage/methylation domain-containing protein [Immundisolibacter sp.]